FENEKETDNIRQAILRYEIEHPVINDQKMVLWRKFGVRAWPTLVLIDPEGYYCGFVSGEGNREVLDRAIAKLIRYHRAKGTLNEKPLRFDLERLRTQPTPLKYPGKVLAAPDSDRLFIADSNHNRIVVCTRSGKLLEVIGSGQIGSTDGDFATASFDHPQGMALVGTRLYVADTENHLIRVVDLDKKRVTTLAGTGRQARGRSQGGPLRRTALNSPWALAVVDKVLYIAMAGPHQIWSHRLGAGTIQVFAGSGREDVRNGAPKDAAFAQPSGLATDGRHLFVADSEGSAIRQISLESPVRVTTLAGPSDLPHGRSLFEFGDRDGLGEQARFQHPLGVVYVDKTLYVADTYNHKIKRLDLPSRRVTTVAEAPGTADGPTRLAEPGGLTYADGKLFIADTNHHRICVLDLTTGKLTELTVAGLRPPE
ncbi:MAG TPA: hypothetical protein EYP14_12300, partial [Planctomycetaceae bacterium]|nr:hypothetical protein [Planctomycetaceae bacterium]